MITVFENQLPVIQSEIERLQQIESMIKMHIHSAKSTYDIEIGKVSIEYCEAEPIFYGDGMYKNGVGKKTLSKMISNFYQDTKKKGYCCAFPLGLHFDYALFLDDRLHEGANFYYHIEKSTTYKPKGLYVVGYIYSKFENRTQFYNKLFCFAKENGYHITNDVYEDYLTNEVSIKNPDEYILKISMKLC